MHRASAIGIAVLATASCGGGVFSDPLDAGPRPGPDGGTGSEDARPPCEGPSCIVQLAAGSSFACALRADGVVACWGSNADAELGATADRATRGPLIVPLMMPATQIAAAATSACAVRADTSLWCWGNVVVPGTLEQTVDPLPYENLTGVAHVSLARGGGSNGCVVLGTGKVACWGTDLYGELGDGTTSLAFDHPRLVPGIDDARDISYGGSHVCVRRATGEMACWGDNRWGEVGTGSVDATASTITPDAVLAPATVGSISDARQIGTSTDSTFALLGDGSLMSWGQGSTVGRGAGLAPSPTPGPVERGTPWRSIGVGPFTACAITTDGRVECWGFNQGGQTGQPAGTNALDPVEIAGVRNATAVAVGWNAACAVVAGAEIMCWGDNSSGQLGDGGAGGPAPILVKWP